MFSTQIDIPHSAVEITYNDRILTLGSCFAENIGTKLQEAFFLTFINPFGVMYNPMSVAQGIRHLLSEKEFTAADLFQSGSLWNSLAHSSTFSATTADEALQKINSRLLAARYFLRETNVMMITLGTAWVFELVDTRKIVSNCHKLPASRFTRRRLSVDEIINEFTEVFGLLRNSYPGQKFIFTVSPIRHWKDGAHENTVSKSTLHLAVDALEKQFDFVHYFPAYEIMMDELRDYRFYAADMIHPSPVAVDFIWDKFKTTLFGKADLELSREITQVKKAMEHRPLNSVSAEYRQFLENSLRTISLLVKNHPVLDFSAEIHYFSKQIENGSEK